MRNLSKMILALLLVKSTFSFADNYPKNYAIDVLHYKFELTLSDKSDELIGQTTIDVLFKTDTSRQLRFDLVNRSAQLQGKGMHIEAVLFENTPISFKHENNALLIQLSKPFSNNKMVFSLTITSILIRIPPQLPFLPKCNNSLQLILIPFAINGCTGRMY